MKWTCWQVVGAILGGLAIVAVVLLSVWVLQQTIISVF